MAKRKRQQAPVADTTGAAEQTQNKKTKAAPAATKKTTKTKGSSSSAAALLPETIQIVAGSYDQVLHGMTADLHRGAAACHFSDTFLFNAHSSAVRCVAVSPVSAPRPGQLQKVLLATGSSDERIHVYSLSAHPPPQDRTSRELQAAKVAPRPILENPKNREVGTLLHHAAPEGRAGEAVGLRTMFINTSQTALPLIFGVLGTALGMAPLFFAMTAALFGGSALARRVARQHDTD